MTAIDMKTDTSSCTKRSDLPSSLFSFSVDCSPFLNWNKEQLKSEHDKAVVFRSLIATMKFQPALDASLEAKAMKLLESVVPQDETSADAFLGNLASISDASLPYFVQTISVFISSPKRTFIKAAMKILDSLTVFCSAQVRLALIKADLIPQLITTLNLLSLSFPEAADIHINLMNILLFSFWLATPYYLTHLEIEDRDEQQAVHETILRQVVTPSEQYICHLCVNRNSIVDEEQSEIFLVILVNLLRICPYYQQTMAFVMNMPIFLTIPSCLAFFEYDHSIWNFLLHMIDTQQEWNESRGENQQLWKKVHRMLRMEGIEDVMEEKLQNDRNGSFGGLIVAKSIDWNNLQGMNLPEQE
ncbi:hypothetical protein BLNAU_8427 [Blattamonas nauphoetae]|uniref:Uncharacterized protein n=1 Tax=Blattamonas nauphoetae TaxID=2049346 RepID=A0ABQ9XYN0_9EUKA|nr:hypothetical protein BLNAU_8427 [Blattamonas nauphoetae]